jgi:hypothetical protein
MYNRFVAKTHYLSTGLKKGQWCDLDTRLLYGMFEEFINFVDTELAMMRATWDDEYATDLGPKGLIWLVRRWKSADLGLSYLTNACIELEDGEFTSRALVAQEMLTLYKWWKVTRPLRVDPFEDVDLCDNLDTSHKIQDLEDHYYEEDTEMLIRLIKIRKSLWT